MLITADAIGDRLKTMFPGMHDWLPTDREYETVEPHEVQLLMTQVRNAADQKWVKNLWECEEIAMATMVAIRRVMRDEAARSARAPRYNLAIGEAYADKLEGREKEHTVNLFATESAIWLFDMQSCRMWQAEKGQDSIYFVRM